MCSKNTCPTNWDVFDASSVPQKNDLALRLPDDDRHRSHSGSIGALLLKSIMYWSGKSLLFVFYSVCQCNVMLEDSIASTILPKSSLAGLPSVLCTCLARRMSIIGIWIEFMFLARWPHRCGAVYSAESIRGILRSVAVAVGVADPMLQKGIQIVF